MGRVHGDYFTERERQREMYLQLLLLVVSPAFGMPSSARVDVGVEVANELDSFVEFSQEAGATLKNPKLFEKVSDRIKEADEKVLEMELHINTLIQKVPELQSEGNFFSKFNEAKVYLRETRQELRNLAMKTVLVRDLKALLGGVNEN